MSANSRYSILMLEHDEDDRYITELILKENLFNGNLKFVLNSDELFDYLGACVEKDISFPHLILLTLNSTPLNAIEVLEQLKSNPAYGHVPVIVLSGSTDEQVVKDCYRRGAASFIVKPDRSDTTDNKIATFVKYWFNTVEL